MSERDFSCLRGIYEGPPPEGGVGGSFCVKKGSFLSFFLGNSTQNSGRTQIAGVFAEFLREFWGQKRPIIPIFTTFRFLDWVFIDFIRESQGF